ncbi:MAG: peptidase [Actinomycetota bacterium]
MGLQTVIGKQRLSFWFGLVVGTVVAIALSLVNSPAASVTPAEKELPTLQVHALPPTLAKWQDPAASGDYFEQIKPPEFGHLIWSQFPIKVYVEPPSNHSQEWVQAVVGVVQEWGAYLPLQVVSEAAIADIKILHQAPPLVPGKMQARSGETHYELWVRQEGNEAILSHRCTIWLNPSQAGKYRSAVARHELGHALGIWGHSPLETDVMYFSQVRNPPAISARDVNTLKRVYEQPTRLGWRVIRSETRSEGAIVSPPRS